MGIKINEARKQEGFTLIELLVVVLIIGILAAIAIPVFLRQRERAWESELTSGVRNVALEVEADAVQRSGNYELVTSLDGAPAITSLSQDTLGDNPLTWNAPTRSTTTFSVCAEHSQLDDRSVTYDSAQGGIQGVTNADC